MLTCYLSDEMVFNSILNIYYFYFCFGGIIYHGVFCYYILLYCCSYAKFSMSIYYFKCMI